MRVFKSGIGLIFIGFLNRFELCEWFVEVQVGKTLSKLFSALLINLSGVPLSAGMICTG